jgi:multiple sugar transport system permease protein
MLVWIFNDLTGILNRGIELIGFQAIPWMSRRGTAFATIVVASVWKTYTFGMLILLAALQGIPVELYESAAIDGAGRVKQFWWITLPMLRPYLLTLLILRSIWSFSMVDLVFVMTYGGPMGATTLLSFHMYQTAFRYGALSYASAMGFHILLLNILLTLLYYRVLRGGEYE